VSHNAEILTLISLIVYAAAALAYGLIWIKTTKILKILSPVILCAGLAVNLFQLVSRWIDTSQPPFKTLYESLVLLAACIALVYLTVELVYRARILGMPSAAGSAGAMLYAYLDRAKESVNLPPALQSGWFIPHVVVYFFGYAALFVAFGASVIYIIRPKPIVIRRPDLVEGQSIDLERLLNGAVRFGFALLTAGLLVGAVWAKAAWGDYWTWDPKETWSMVTWFIFAAYIHLYGMKKWRGKKLAWLVIIGFGAVMFTYLGMNLLPTAEQSIHVYQ